MALCANCGNDIFGGKVCYSCGTRVGGSPIVSSSSAAPMQLPTDQQQPQYQPQQFQQPQYQPQYPQQFQPNRSGNTNGMAIASLICAFFIFPLGIIFGHIAMGQIKRTGEGGKGLATAGLIIGYLVLGFLILL